MPASVFMRPWTLPVAVGVLTLSATTAALPARVEAADPLSTAIERMRAGQYSRVLDELARLTRPGLAGSRPRLSSRARYLKARALERLGEWEHVPEALPTALRTLTERVAKDVRCRRARLLARTGRCAQALPQLETLAASDVRMRALAGECALALGDPATAQGHLRRALATPNAGIDAYAVRVLLAETQARLGDRVAASAEMRRLLVERPDHPATEALLAQFGAWGEAFKPTWEQRLTRAERWLRVAQPARALEELNGVRLPRARASRARWLHTRGTALYKSRTRYPEAARVLARAARLGGPLAARDAFHAARALSRSNRNRAAVAAYTRLLKRYPKSSWSVQAEYLAAWLRLSRRGTATRPMERFLRGRRAARSPRLVRDALWQLGFSAYERRRYRRAITLLERYAERSSDALVRARGLYWAARARHKQKDRAGAIRAYRKAMAVEPLHWYALMARARLEQLGQKPGPPFGPTQDSLAKQRAPTVHPDLPADVRFYWRLGLNRDAARALREQERAYRARAEPGRGVESLVAAYHRLDEHARPLRLALRETRGGLVHPPVGPRRWVWDALYPRPYRDRVRAEQRRHKLPQGYLHAIMRQESAFDPEVVSYADAIGLMQLIPPTARKVAKTLGVPYERERMFVPEWNIRFGAQLCARLLREFRGQAPLAIAAYNAGSHRVRSWLSKARVLELDHFVERIPIDQTRNYVRRVVTHWARYRYLDKPNGRWPLRLAARVRRAGLRPPL